MKRLTFALLISIIIHSLILSINYKSFTNKKIKNTKSVKINLSSTDIKQKSKTPGLKHPEIIAINLSPQKTYQQKSSSKKDIKHESVSNKNKKIKKNNTNKTKEIVLGTLSTGHKANVDAAPLYKKNPIPIYPESAIRKGFEGTVILNAYVDIFGKVMDIKLFKSSGFPVLDKSAIKAVRKWIFQPGLKDNKKIKMWVKVPVKYELKNAKLN